MFLLWVFIGSKGIFRLADWLSLFWFIFGFMILDQESSLEDVLSATKSLIYFLNCRSTARLVDQIRLFKQMRYAFQTNDEVKERLKQRIQECKSENLHALASENASNFHLSSSQGSRKFHDAFRKMKATFGGHNWRCLQHSHLAVTIRCLFISGVIFFRGLVLKNHNSLRIW